MTVRYRRVSGFGGRYCVGTDGSVWSRRKATRNQSDGWRRMKPKKIGNGYYAVILHANGGEVTRYCHRLVLEVFVGPPGPGQEAAHNNGVRTDNRLENLRWASRRENHADKLKHGTDNRGDKHPMRKLDSKRVQIARLMLRDGFTQKAVARIFRVSPAAVSNIALRKSWSHVPEWEPLLPTA